jgi:hypothetical protein
MGQLLQLALHERDQLLERSGVSVVPGAEEAGDLRGIAGRHFACVHLATGADPTADMMQSVLERR